MEWARYHFPRSSTLNVMTELSFWKEFRGENEYIEITGKNSCHLGGLESSSRRFISYLSGFLISFVEGTSFSFGGQDEKKM